MIHAAVEQCQPGDILVVTTTSPSSDGAFGELLATSLQQRGARGLVTTGGVRDTAELKAMNFPAFAGYVSAQGTVKATAGAVNVPVSIAGQRIRAGDAILADDDGVLTVPREQVGQALAGAASAPTRKPPPGPPSGRRARSRPIRAAVKLGELNVEYLSYERYVDGDDRA